MCAIHLPLDVEGSCKTVYLTSTIKVRKTNKPTSKQIKKTKRREGAWMPGDPTCRACHKIYTKA